jgi:hypothetical protein
MRVVGRALDDGGRKRDAGRSSAGAVARESLHHGWPARRSPRHSWTVPARPERTRFDRFSRTIGHRDRCACGKALIVVSDHERKAGRPTSSRIHAYWIEFVSWNSSTSTCGNARGSGAAIPDCRATVRRRAAAVRRNRPRPERAQTCSYSTYSRISVRSVGSPPSLSCAGRRPSSLCLLMKYCTSRGTKRVLVEVERLDDLLDEPQLILAVEDLEALRQAGFAPVQPQQPMREAVESAEPHGRPEPPSSVSTRAAHFRRPPCW